MLLTIDVGNSSIAGAVFNGNTIVQRGVLATPKKWSARNFSILLPAALAPRTTAVIISSVVPAMDRDLAANIKKVIGKRALFLDHKTPTGITLKIDRPSELGADRIADCAGALTLFSPPLIVIDSGTATTFDLLNARSEYCGGCIFPGIGIAIESLAENTAKLKKITFQVPSSPVGTNTAASIRAGVYFGYIGTLQHLIACYRKILGPKSKVVATGGLSRYFKGRISGIDMFVPDLLFIGLKSIFEQQSPGP
ncbi:MAG: type III pantothenate kinase [Candidatus Aminicenantes bacterium]|nr:type III pantothenate kinase [Candidatus Aminicenantes bacterium]